MGGSALICLRCGHYRNADREMARIQRSDDCPCSCHTPADARLHATQTGRPAEAADATKETTE